MLLNVLLLYFNTMYYAYLSLLFYQFIYALMTQK